MFPLLPVWEMVAVLTLALAIGVTTATTSVSEVLLL